MMNYSDEIINAYVDGELVGPEKESFKQDMQTNEELAEKVRALFNLKKSIQLSYSQIPLPESNDDDYSRSRQMNFRLAAVAAVLVLCVGFFLGSSIGVNYEQNNNSVAEQDNIINGIQLTPVSLQKPNKIILHVSNSDPEVLYKTLYKIDTILETYNENKMPFKLEVVANSGGIDLFRKDVSPYKNRIEQIIRNYSDVSFIACTNAMEKLRLKGIEPDLIAETKTGVTAIEQIVKRLQEGWVYLKV